jgi:hypothetical protein
VNPSHLVKLFLNAFLQWLHLQCFDSPSFFPFSPPSIVISAPRIYLTSCLSLTGLFFLFNIVEFDDPFLTGVYVDLQCVSSSSLDRLQSLDPDLNAIAVQFQYSRSTVPSPPSPCPDAYAPHDFFPMQRLAFSSGCRVDEFPRRRIRVPVAARSSSAGGAGGRRGRVPSAFQQPSRHVPGNEDRCVDP